ncbi:MAG: hypothetical protein WCT14_07185, partial [Treponemataceae bacterium]
MSNRFVRGILDGSIGSLEDLKAAYKTEAKLTHPDLAEVVGHEEFLNLRKEYEHALKELDRGARKSKTDGAGDERPTYATGMGDPYAALELLLKRGFPKTPRHQKEILRYRNVRLRARSALSKIDSALPRLFDAMEKELIDAEGFRLEAAKTVLALLTDYLKAKRTHADALETAVRMECARTFPPVS